MARPLRLEYEGAVYHVTSRGNARQDIFLVDPDRELFLQILADTVQRFGWICHAYCLMTNHYHLLVETPEANLSRGMRHLNGVYTQAFNRRHMRTGHVLQGRFKAIVVERESHLLELARYVVLNPVRARVVRSAKDWPWSSYRATAALVDAPPFLTTDWILEQLHRDPRHATSAYRRYVKEGRDVDAWAELRGGILLGGDDFVAELKPLLSDHEAARELPRRERLVTRPGLAELLSSVHDKDARNQQVHDAVRVHEYTLKAVADFVGLRPSTISIIAARIARAVGHEKGRSDPPLGKDRMTAIERNKLGPGSEVRIVQEQDQRSGTLTGGVVKDVLTKSPTHPHGIKVRLETGEVGRVKEILSKS